MPHLGSQQILESKKCTIQQETPDKETKKDEVGKKYQDVHHLNTKYDSKVKFRIFALISLVWGTGSASLSLFSPPLLS
jgi:hypothetical protein